MEGAVLRREEESVWTLRAGKEISGHVVRILIRLRLRQSNIPTLLERHEHLLRRKWR
jgi:hypothetical protein